MNFNKKSWKFVCKGLINKTPALDHIMAWRRPGDKPLSEPMMVSLLTHICVTRPQWIKGQVFLDEIKKLTSLDLLHKSHNARYCNKNMHICAHFCYKWCIMGYGTGALWDSWDGSNRTDYKILGLSDRLCLRWREARAMWEETVI